MAITRQKIFEHFQTSTVVTDEMWSDIELVMEVVYSILPLYKEDITDYKELLRDRTVIALGFSYNEKHFLRRHIAGFGGNFRFTKNNKENFFIVHRKTWLYDMLYALRMARENGAIIISFDTFIKNLNEKYSEESEEKIKSEERRIEASKTKNGPIYKACSKAYLAGLPRVSMADISLYDDVFHIIGNTENALRDAYEEVLYSPGSHSFSDFKYLGDYYKRKEIYEIIDKKGGRYVKKEESPNITCVIYGKEPSERAIKYFEGKAKLINVVDAVNWLEKQEPISPEARIFAERYKSSVDKKLRTYQQSLKDEVFLLWRKNFNIMLQLPTGTGKTVLFTSIIRDLSVVKDAKIIILAHRKELIDQISEHLGQYDIDHGIITSGIKRNLQKNVQVASVQTLTHDNNIELLDELKPNFIIIDEAHHSLADSYTKFWKKCGDCWKLGVTATPYRLNNKSFRSHFDALVKSMEIDDFIMQGYLSKYDYMVDNPKSSLSQTIKSIKEKSSTGDYKTATLLKELNVPQHIQRLVVCYEQYVKGQKGIVYAINKEHAHNICDAYKLIGIEAVYIDSDTSKTERSEIVEKFKSGDVQVMVNVDIFSEGFDCPDVEFIQLARPTWSLAKYLQQVGRGMRPCKSKQETVILDNSRMFVKFGLPSEGRFWQLHFNGDPLVKNKYKQENIEYEKQLNLVCNFSNEMMVKIDHDTIKIAEELAIEEKKKQKMQKRAEEEAMRAAKLAEEEERRKQHLKEQQTFINQLTEDKNSEELENLRHINEDLMTQISNLKKEIVFKPNETANAQRQSQRRKRQEENEQIKIKLKAERERRYRENKERLQKELEIEEDLERRERTNKLWKALGCLIAASIAIVIVYQTGLIIPLGILGLIYAFGLKK